MSPAEVESNQRVALVTGAAPGIGLAIAQRLAGEGYSVAFHSRAPAEAGHAIAASLPDASYFSADLLDDDARRRLIEQVLAHDHSPLPTNEAIMLPTLPAQQKNAAERPLTQALSRNTFYGLEYVTVTK